jgi:hypothetical protein
MNTNMPGLEKPGVGDDCPFCGRAKAMIVDPENWMIHCISCPAWWHWEVF